MHIAQCVKNLKYYRSYEYVTRLNWNQCCIDFILISSICWIYSHFILGNLKKIQKMLSFSIWTRQRHKWSTRFPQIAQFFFFWICYISYRCCVWFQRIWFTYLYLLSGSILGRSVTSVPPSNNPYSTRRLYFWYNNFKNDIFPKDVGNNIFLKI